MIYNTLLKNVLNKNKINVILTYNYKILFNNYIVNNNIELSHTNLFDLLYFNIKYKNKKLINISVLDKSIKYFSLGLLLNNTLLKKSIRRSTINIKLLVNLFINNFNKKQVSNIGLYFNSYCLKKLLNYYFNLLSSLNLPIKFYSISNFLSNNVKIKRSIKRRISKRVM